LDAQPLPPQAEIGGRVPLADGLGCPLGDNMMTGTVGLLEALRRREKMDPIFYVRLISGMHALARLTRQRERSDRKSDRLKEGASETQKSACIRLPDQIWVASYETAVPLATLFYLTP